MKKQLLRFSTLLPAFLAVSLQAAEPFEVTPLPYPRNMHGTTAANNYLIVVGGDTPTGFTSSVQISRVNSDRTISAWIEARPLPVKLIYISNSTTSADNVVYVAGGQIVEDSDNPANYSKQDNNKVFFSRMSPDGLLSEWQATAPWPTNQCLGSTAVAASKRLYVIGGGETASQQAHSEVFVSDLSPVDGTPGAWKSVEPLPNPLWFHSSFVVNDRIYTAGGRKGIGAEDIVSTMYWTTINADGTLGAWQLSSSPLKYPVNSAAACATDRFAFLFGGMTTDGSLLPTVQIAQWTAEGPSEWQSTETTMPARYYSAATVSPTSRAVYITAGRRSTFYQDMIANVYCYPLKEDALEVKVADIRKEPGFLSLAEAAAVSGNESRPMLIYFYSTKSVSSFGLMKALSTSPTFFRDIGEFVPAAVNVTESPDLARKYDVMRLPTVLILDAEGQVLGTTSGLLSQQEIIQFIRQTRPAGK